MNVADVSAVIAEAKETVLEQRATIKRLMTALLEIHGHLGCAKNQRAASDDNIIAQHIEDADNIALLALHGPKTAPLVAKNTEDLLRFVMFGDRPR